MGPCSNTVCLFILGPLFVDFFLYFFCFLPKRLQCLHHWFEMALLSMQMGRNWFLLTVIFDNHHLFIKDCICAIQWSYRFMYQWVFKVVSFQVTPVQRTSMKLRIGLAKPRLRHTLNPLSEKGKEKGLNSHGFELKEVRPLALNFSLLKNISTI